MLLPVVLSRGDTKVKDALGEMVCLAIPKKVQLPVAAQISLLPTGLLTHGAKQQNWKAASILSAGLARPQVSLWPIPPSC